MERVMRWEVHYPEEIPTSINYDSIPLYHFLEKSVERFAEKKALHGMGKELTFKELYDESKRVANYLQTLGLQKGDRVAIMLRNCQQEVISYYGALMAGGIVVQTNPVYTERELEYQMIDSGDKYIVCLDILVPRVTNIRNNTSLEHILVTGIKDYLPFPKNLI